MTDIRVHVEKVLFDPKIGASVVLLKENDGERELPIWIGQAEALSIAMAVEKVRLPRPMTHDLMQSILEGLKVSLVWVRVHTLKDGTFYATVRLNSPAGQTDIDSRPSDALAIALRMGAPVFVAEVVLNEAIKEVPGVPNGVEDLNDDFLANLPDEVFGKYKM